MAVRRGSLIRLREFGTLHLVVEVRHPGRDVIWNRSDELRFVPPAGDGSSWTWSDMVDVVVSEE